MDIEYFKEELNKDITMGEIGLLYYEDIFQKEVFTKIIVSTILMLSLKKYLKIENEKGQRITIIIEKDAKNREPLKKSEKLILKCLKESDFNIDERIQSIELEVGIATIFNGKKAEIKESIIKDAIENNYIDERQMKKKQNHFNLAAILLVGIFFACGMLTLRTIIVICVLLIIDIIQLIGFFKTDIYTKKAYEEKNRIIGLKNYLEDYSLIKERDIMEVYLWEKFLAYSVILGVNSKIEQSVFGSK